VAGQGVAAVRSPPSASGPVRSAVAACRFAAVRSLWGAVVTLLRHVSLFGGYAAGVRHWQVRGHKPRDTSCGYPQKFADHRNPTQRSVRERRSAPITPRSVRLNLQFWIIEGVVIDTDCAISTVATQPIHDWWLFMNPHPATLLTHLGTRCSTLTRSWS